METPYIETCFWCGEDKNLILDSSKDQEINDEETERVLLDYEPCKDCMSFFQKGYLFIEVDTEPFMDNQPPIIENVEGHPVYPTGNWVVLNEDKLEETLKNIAETLDYEDFKLNKEKDFNEDHGIKWVGIESPTLQEYFERTAEEKE